MHGWRHDRAAELLPPALAAAQPVDTACYVLRVDDVTRLALTPTEVAPLLGLSRVQVIELCRQGLLRVRNLHPGSRNGRYLIPVGALIEYLAGRDEPVPSTYN